jgi:hypothetical protein
LHPSVIYFATIATDLVILAINTGKVTPAEKQVANPIYAAYNRFFAMMNTDGTDIETSITPAYSNLSFQPVGVAVAWTNVASG